jgi:tryptophanyl-tRNA synthetase
MLYERIEREVAPMRERYEALIAHPDRIEATLIAGAEKARQLSAPFIRELRQAVGLRALNQQAGVRAARADKTALPAFKQYREKDGQFYFKLVDPKGTVLLQSTGYASPRDAGQAIARLQGEGPAALTALAPNLAPVQGVTIHRHRTGPAGAARRRRRLTRPDRNPSTQETCDDVLCDRRSPVDA